MVVVMRTRFGRPDLGRPTDGRRFSSPMGSSLSGHTQEPLGAIVKDVGERDAVFYRNISGFLSNHRLHVNPYFRADRWPPDACGRQLPMKSRGAWIALNRRRGGGAAATRSIPARIDPVAHEFGDRRHSERCSIMAGLVLFRSLAEAIRAGFGHTPAAWHSLSSRSISSHVKPDFDSTGITLPGTKSETELGQL